MKWRRRKRSKRASFLLALLNFKERKKKKSEKTRFLFHFSFAPFQLPTLFVFSPKRWRA